MNKCKENFMVDFIEEVEAKLNAVDEMEIVIYEDGVVDSYHPSYIKKLDEEKVIYRVSIRSLKDLLDSDWTLEEIAEETYNLYRSL